MARGLTGKVIDPVCGMEVDPIKAPQTCQVLGQTYYFCSNYCAELFDPEMTAEELTRLRAVIRGQEDQTLPALVGWGQVRPGEAIPYGDREGGRSAIPYGMRSAIKKLLGLLFGGK